MYHSSVLICGCIRLALAGPTELHWTSSVKATCHLYESRQASLLIDYGNDSCFTTVANLMFFGVCLLVWLWLELTWDFVVTNAEIVCSWD
jgi:hypothetical protein